MMKYKLFVLLAFLTISCTGKNKTVAAPENKASQDVPENTEPNFNFIWDAKSQPIANADHVLARLSDRLTVDFVYPDKHAIPDSDSIIVAHKLEQKGLRIIDRGRGNWMHGPRVLSYTMGIGRLYLPGR